MKKEWDLIWLGTLPTNQSNLMFNTIKKRPQIFKRLVWVSLEVFKKMIEVVEKAEEKRLWWETRWRNEKLSLENQILLALLYLRTYTTYLSTVHFCLKIARI